MATVQMNRFAAESGRMPSVCICCGTAARQQVRHTFYYQPTWLVLIYIFLPRVLKWHLSRNPATVTVPVCAAHRRRLKWPTFIGYALAAGLLLLVPAMLAASIAGWLNLLSFLGLSAILWAVALWIAHVIVTLSTPRAEHYSTSTVTLTAVSPAFAKALQVGGVGAQQGMRPLPGLAGTKTAVGPRPVGGLTQGMLALLIMSVGGIALVVVCFAIGFGAYYVRKASLGRMQHVAHAPPHAPNWGPPQIPPPTTFPHTPPGWMPPAGAPSHQMPPADFALNPTTNPNAVAPNPLIPPAPPTASTSVPSVSVLPDSASGKVGNIVDDPTFGETTQPIAGESPPPGSTAVTTATPLRPGSRVWHLWGSQWYPSEVVALIGPEIVRIHYFGYTATFDAEVPRDELRLPSGSQVAGANGAAAKPTGPSIPAIVDSAKQADSEVRTWTDASGKFKIQAKLLEYKDGKVRLERTDGKVVTLPFDKLSGDDQFYLATQSD